jgi:hypothetical protein
MMTFATNFERAASFCRSLIGKASSAGKKYQTEKIKNGTRLIIASPLELPKKLIDLPARANCLVAMIFSFSL